MPSAKTDTHTQSHHAAPQPDTPAVDPFPSPQHSTHASHNQPSLDQPKFVKRIPTASATSILGKLDERPATHPNIYISQPPPCEIQQAFASAIRSCLHTKPRLIRSAQFRFDTSDTSLTHNWSVIESHSCDFHTIMAAHADTPLGFGSEFRLPSTLAPILHHHPWWERLHRTLTSGAELFAPLPDENARRLDLAEAMAFGNHSGATDQPDLLRDILRQEITKGWQIPIPMDRLPYLPGCVLTPLNIVTQDTINERGEIIPKNRLTNNQSMVWTASGTSTNSRVIDERLPPCLFGHSLSRVIHSIVALRLRFPDKRILLAKADWKSAYRRCQPDVQSILQQITALDADTALIGVRLSFGGKPWPAQWSVISEMTTDLINDMLLCDTFDLAELGTSLGVSVPDRANNIPGSLAPAQPIRVDVSVNPRGQVDCYIDDHITVVLDHDNHVSRASFATPIGFQIMGRPLQTDEPLPRDELECGKKRSAEGAMSESKIYLGWLINTHAMSIHLPQHKATAWSDTINQILDRGYTKRSDLETLVGRINHIGNIIRLSRHFISRIRHFKDRSPHFRRLKISKTVAADLQLWLQFIQQARHGMSLNLLTHRIPTVVYRTDSSEHGMGGFNSRGRAWRWELPLHLVHRVSLNTLEFLASVVSIMVDGHEGTLIDQDCALIQTDSTTGEGWLRKSNFCSVDRSQQLIIARALASTCLDHNVCLYSDWIQGTKNTIADSLSRDFDVSDSHLTHSLSRMFPSQVPPNFHISPVPNEISSWLTSLLASAPATRESPPLPTRSGLQHGHVGSSSCPPLAFPTTNSSTESAIPLTNTASSQPSHQPSETDAFLSKLLADWLQEPSRAPSATWQRPSNCTTGWTPDSTSKETLHSFYNARSDTTVAPMAPTNNNAQPQSA